MHDPCITRQGPRLTLGSQTGEQPPKILQRFVTLINEHKGGAQRKNLQILEDTQVGYISQKYTLDKYTLERAFKPSYTFSSI